MDTHLDFLEFVAERLEVERKKALGLPRPWTQDPIIRDTRFTNINRNHDRGTISLFAKVRHLPASEAVLYVVWFRCAYSNLGLLGRFTLDPVQDLALIESRRFKLIGRKPYQVYLKKDQTMMDFLASTGVIVADFIAGQLPILTKCTIKEFSDKVADRFKRSHGKRMVFLATEISKDLSVLFPESIDPDSVCHLNVGAKKGLRLIGPKWSRNKVAALLGQTGLNYSQTEHALCEFSKFVERSKHYGKPTFKKAWRYEPSQRPTLTFAEVFDSAA